eukprot:11243430-Alexandrium_andersonii.AAC.1
MAVGCRRRGDGYTWGSRDGAFRGVGGAPARCQFHFCVLAAGAAARSREVAAAAVEARHRPATR